jgi:dihydroneopterin aldolase
VSGDRLLLDRLEFRAHLGVTDEERSVAQDVEVHLELEVDAHAAAVSDSVMDTVDYMDVATRVGALIARVEHRLVERLATKIAEEILTDPRISSVTVELRKRASDLPGSAARAGVRLTRP